MGWINRRRMVFAAAAAAALAATMGGCSSTSNVSTASAQPSSGMAAGDGLMPGERISMAAGDKLGLVVYATDRAIARREARERPAFASVPTE